jgi:hypothetical protein
VTDTDIERRLRSALLAQSEHRVDVDHAWRKFQRRRQSASRRRRAWLAVAAAVAVVAALSPAIVGRLHGEAGHHRQAGADSRRASGHRSRAHRVPPAATYPGAVVARIRVSGARGIAAVGGNLWVVTSSNELVRINGRTNAITRRVRIGGIGQNGAELAAGGGALWLAPTPNSGQQQLFRIDPATGRILASIPLPGECGPMAYGIGHLWIVCGADPPVRILRIDPATDRVSARTGTIDSSADPIVAGPEGVWYSGSKITQVDPSGTRLSGVTVNDSAFPVSLDSAELALGQGAVWAFSQSEDIAKIDPVTGRIVRTYASQTYDPSYSLGAWGFAVGQGSMWILGDFAKAQVIRVSMRTGRVLGRVNAGGCGPECSQLADALGAVWVITQWDLVRIDPARLPG